MPLSRRAFITNATLAATSWTLLSRRLHSQPPPAPTLSRTPDPTTFESGDLLWPKAPTEFVPYSARQGASEQSDAARWIRERNAYIATLNSSSSLTPEDRERFTALHEMTYDGFKATYLQPVDTASIQQMGAGGLPVSVGHVALLDLRSGNPLVLEAVWDVVKCIRTIPYAAWLAGRPGEYVWHGRLLDASPEKRLNIVEIASTYIGTPYDFWNFNLEDTTGFYCSKLAWLSIRKALNVAPDDNLNPRRVLWYSPKQLMHSHHLAMRFYPGSYATRLEVPR
jgi:cell wall-associated NlpC family hydrolase